MTDAGPALIEAALRGAFVLLMVLLAPRLWRAASAPEARLAAGLALGAAGYAVQSALLARGPLQAWQAPLQAVAAGNPIVVLLLSWALFDDGFRLRPWHGAAWAGWVALSLGNCYGWRSGPLGGALEAAPIGFSLAAMWPVLRYWRDDLVESRLRLRGRIVLGVLGYTVLSTVAGLPAGAAAAPSWLRLADAVLLLAVGLFAAWPLLRLAPDGLLQPAEPSPVPAVRAPPPVGAGATSGRQPDGPPGAADASDRAADDATDGAAEAAADLFALRRLERALAERQPWRREGLTIGDFAADLGLPEYRLRRVINRRLGHRNFNAFLNSHRIAQARAALADPTQASTAVLAIALEAGFQSLGPFNRAFKAETGLTPSDYRRQALGDGCGASASAPAPAGDSPNPAIAG